MNELYLLPVPLAEKEFSSSLPSKNAEILTRIEVFFVENLKSARRFIAAQKLEIDINKLVFLELDKHSSFEHVFDCLLKYPGKIGVLSEAGCPGIADPGALAVEAAHELGWKVIPLVGPSSILLTLMASGFNGQNFAFHGYLPIDKKERKNKLKELERQVISSGQTQLFMETPYRNLQLFQAILETCQNSTKLCIAANLTAPDAFIKTTSIGQWKQKSLPDLHKKPAIFCFGNSLTA